jgi:hypothetical protein
MDALVNLQGLLDEAKCVSDISAGIVRLALTICRTRRWPGIASR